MHYLSKFYSWKTLGALLLGVCPCHATLAGEATPISSISVRDGFQVELLRSAQDGEDSWISMTFDNRG